MAPPRSDLKQKGPALDTAGPSSLPVHDVAGSSQNPIILSSDDDIISYSNSEFYSSESEVDASAHDEGREGVSVLLTEETSSRINLSDRFVKKTGMGSYSHICLRDAENPSWYVLTPKHINRHGQHPGYRYYLGDGWQFFYHMKQLQHAHSVTLCHIREGEIRVYCNKKEV